MEELRKAYKTTVIIGLAMMASLLVFLIVVSLFEEGAVKIATAPLPENIVQVIKFVLLGITVICFFLIKYVGKRALRSGEEQQKRYPSTVAPYGPLLGATVITFAFCELPALLGLMMYFLGRNTADFYLFLLISLLFFSTGFPRFSQWEEWYRQQGRERGTGKA